MSLQVGFWVVFVTTLICLPLAFVIKRDAASRNLNAETWFNTAIGLWAFPVVIFMGHALFALLGYDTVESLVVWLTLAAFIAFVFPIVYLLSVLTLLTRNFIADVRRKIEQQNDSPITVNQERCEENIPATCPHCKSPNENKLSICEWCGGNTH